MEVPAIYAIAAGGIFLALFLIQTRYVLVDWTESFSVLLSGHLTLPVLVRRHRVLGPWTRAGILVHVSYIAVNIALVFLRTESLVDSGRRAGALALINMIFPLSTAHLGFLAGLLGITWHTCRKIHRATGWTAVALLSFHIIAELQGKTFRFPLTETRNLLTVIGSSALGILALFSIPYFRRWSYEIFLRSHQILAGLFVYGTWQHIPAHASSARLYVYVTLSILGLTTLLELAIHLYRNGIFSGHGAPRALIDDVLEDDIIDKGYILSISIYVEHGLANSRTPVGKHERICYYQGLPDYREIISTEASGSQIERLPNIPDEPGRTLVMVSASDGLRDRLRDIARGYLHQGVELSELEYQPE
ncbi:hypothetical protein N7460_011243 [Penicillium canescens]|uniref:Ferric oxidoreductase domain-containing protein n=1 Tax=Penicillium canescens TaxID=5083 RepID=A0AAD6N3A7_PENCN|nr:hypothetical protein N7460_011243 [Penicillium canescens]